MYLPDFSEYRVILDIRSPNPNWTGSVLHTPGEVNPSKIACIGTDRIWLIESISSEDDSSDKPFPKSITERSKGILSFRVFVFISLKRFDDIFRLISSCTAFSWLNRRISWNVWQLFAVKSALLGSIRIRGDIFLRSCLNILYSFNSRKTSSASVSYSNNSLTIPSYIMFSSASTVISAPFVRMLVPFSELTINGTPNSLATVAIWPVELPTSVIIALARRIIWLNRGELYLVTAIPPAGKIAGSSSSSIWQTFPAAIPRWATCPCLYIITFFWASISLRSFTDIFDL